MIRDRRVAFCAVLLAMAACAEDPGQQPLPLPPPSPPRAQPVRTAPPPPRPPAAAEAAPAAPRAQGPWRVARDGTTGCADPAAVRLVRQGDTTPRLLAQAREAGGCRTTFRVNEWAFEAEEGELVRLRLVNGAPLTLWFARNDLIAP